MTNQASDAPLAVDPAIQAGANDDVDSALGSDISTYTETLRSSIHESVKENGRTYHKYHDGTYMMPDDVQEQERLDVQHELFLKILDRKLVLAPIGKEVTGHVRELP